MSLQKMTAQLKEKAQKAITKPAVYGEDLDLDNFTREAEAPPMDKEAKAFSAQDRERMISVGIDVAEKEARSGSFIQINHAVCQARSSQEGLEIMGVTEALEKYDWLWDYYWRLVAVDADKYTAHCELNPHQGYFIRALPGAKLTVPVQACLYLSHENLAQNVHNIIIAEEGAELNIISGCASAISAHRGLHIGISEFYVKRHARLSFTMIHAWGKQVSVRPRSAALLEDKASFVSNYVSLRCLKSLQMYPTTYCRGKEATAIFNSVLVAPSGSHLDVGAQIILAADNSRAEIVSRAISRGGTINARGRLIGQKPGIKGHLECRGLLLDDRGHINAIPELLGEVSDVDLSHEAAVGKIAEEEILYLTARGLSRDEATAVIVRGFLSVDMKGLPASLKQQIDRAIKMSDVDAM